MGIIDNIANIRARRQYIVDLKYKLVQRFTIDQLLETYKKYVYVPSQPMSLTKTSPDTFMGAMQIMGESFKPTIPSNRTKLIDGIISSMSLDLLLSIAKKYKIQTEDIK